mgnify:CR=1 FL=1
MTKDAPDHAEEALIKLLNLTLAVQDHSMVDRRIFNGLDKAENGASVFYLPVSYRLSLNNYERNYFNSFMRKIKFVR